MRMTIYLLDGCSADYVINKNNFISSLAMEKFKMHFLIGLQENIHPFRTAGNAVWVVGVVDQIIWKQKRLGLGIMYGKPLFHNIK